MNRILIFVLLAFFIKTGRALASSEVRFTPKELKAGFVLLRPELNSIELNGRKGVFTPAPALRFFGIEDQIFEINFNSLIDLIDLEFNHLKAKVPEVRFVDGALELSIPLFDQETVLQSRLGSISIQGVSLVAILGWQGTSDGHQELVLTHARFNGDLKGTGILRSDYILMKTKKFLLHLLSKQVRVILQSPAVQDSVGRGLQTWARFTLGFQTHEVIPGSIGFDQEGIHYRVQ